MENGRLRAVKIIVFFIKYQIRKVDRSLDIDIYFKAMIVPYINQTSSLFRVVPPSPYIRFLWQK